MFSKFKSKHKLTNTTEGQLSNYHRGSNEHTTGSSESKCLSTMTTREHFTQEYNSLFFFYLAMRIGLVDNFCLSTIVFAKNKMRKIFR